MWQLRVHTDAILLMTGLTPCRYGAVEPRVYHGDFSRYTGHGILDEDEGEGAEGEEGELPLGAR